MAQEFNGDILVLRTVTAGRRVNQGAISKAITGTEQFNLHSAMLQILDASSAQDAVLPDATTLNVGWAIEVKAAGTANISVKTYHATTPVLKKTIISGRRYRFVCVDNSDAAGTWDVNYLEESDLVISERYQSTFDATSSWGSASGGYYTITILASSHERGTTPAIVGVFKESGSDYVQLEPDSKKVLANGDIEIKVIENPDGRFAGKILIM
jgi:hypothetical protein